jgi:hypothetical protein
VRPSVHAQSGLQLRHTNTLPVMVGHVAFELPQGPLRQLRIGVTHSGRTVSPRCASSRPIGVGPSAVLRISAAQRPNYDHGGLEVSLAIVR